MKRKFKSRIMAFALTGVMLLSSCTGATNNSGTTPASESSEVNNEGSEVSLKDDFYTAINAKWLETAEIPSDSAIYNNFTLLSDNIDNQLREDFAEMMKTGVPEEYPELQKFIALYEKALNFEERNAAGVEPIMPYVNALKDLTSLGQLINPPSEILEDSVTLPFAVLPTVDMRDSSKYILQASMPGLILGSKDYYGTEGGDTLLAVYEEMLVNLLVMVGKTDEEAGEIAAQAIAFDQRLVEYAPTAEETASYATSFNPISYQEFVAQSKNIDFSDYISQKVQNINVEEITVKNVSYFKDIDRIVNEDNLEEIKSWMLAQLLVSCDSYLSEEYLQASSAFGHAMMGITDEVNSKENAYNKTWALFSTVVGDYYGRTYLGEEAKAEATKIVETVIAQFKVRLQSNNWLSEETKAEAIVKLDAMRINIGYPDEITGAFSKYKIDENATYLDNVMGIGTVMLEDLYSYMGTEVDSSMWPLSADTINAMYAGSLNSINFPAAFLQAPYFSLDQTDSQNYGGFGAVVAHEISHAFDTNGSAFDENGNMRNWWAEEDFTEFNKRAELMLTQFQGLPYASGEVNGTMTLAENIADAGGLSCALDALKGLPEFDLEEFFISWATIWRTKETASYEEMALMMDLHAPNIYRTNIQLQNMDDFYTTFDIQEGDDMWIAPEDRITIW